MIIIIIYTMYAGREPDSLFLCLHTLATTVYTQKHIYRFGLGSIMLSSNILYILFGPHGLLILYTQTGNSRLAIYLIHRVFTQ